MRSLRANAKWIMLFLALAFVGWMVFDVGMDVVLPIALAARPQALVFESSNPRHGHEWEVFAEADLPDDKILVPGVIDSTRSAPVDDVID